jgi:hypothetical protein
MRFERGQDLRSPNQIASVGLELLPWARARTNGSNEAHFLVHQVVTRLMNDTGAECETVDVREAKAWLATMAQRNLLAEPLFT